MDKTEHLPFSKKLILALLKENLLSDADSHKIQEQSIAQGVSLVHCLIESRLISSCLLAEQTAALSGLPLIDLHKKPRDTSLETPFNVTFLRQNRLIPLWQEGNLLSVGLSDPSQLYALKNMQFGTGLNIQPVLIKDDQLETALNEICRKDLNQVTQNNGDYSQQNEKIKNEIIDIKNQEDAPTIKFINQLLQNAIRNGASDLHFEPQENHYRIRQRCDGKLNIISEPPLNLAESITIRLKIISGLDISEKRKPQDGRVRLTFANLPAVDARINCLPTLWGEKIAIRLLDPRKSLLKIEELGLEEEQRNIYLDAITKSQGMILVTGPTGSGKTVSLYSALNYLNKPDINISTAEDPVEINLPGINQVNINPKQGLDFSRTLRSFLRQDPDILMIGEIRDKETAEIAIKSAQTGHLVFSTLHTNSALETINRLYNMGIPSVDIASSVTLIIAQRLVRKLCLQCRIPVMVSEEIFQNFLELGTPKESINIFMANGCPACQAGYKGRVGIYELLPINKEAQEIILNSKNLKQQLKEKSAIKFTNLRNSGLLKVLQGLTSLEEINLITKE